MTSMAHMPKTMGLSACPTMAERFESEPEGEGECERLVSRELDRGERRSCGENIADF